MKHAPFLYSYNIVFGSAELQKIIDEKTAELAKRTEELKARSAQPQRCE